MPNVAAGALGALLTPRGAAMDTSNWTLLRSARWIGALMIGACWQLSDASQSGRNGFSGNPSTNGGAICSACHTPGAATPTVTINGPSVVDAGTSALFTVTISGGPGASAGVNISDDDPNAVLAPVDSELRTLSEELSHTAPKPFGAGAVVFDFSWTAPSYNTTATLYAAGNSSNGAIDLSGDGVGSHTFAINVINGVGGPPPPPAPGNATITLESFASGLNAPVAITNAGDPRLFVVERAGRIRIVDASGALQTTPFLDIEARVDDRGSEMGLLGLAFHPNYAVNGYFYVYYTYDPGDTPFRSRVARFQVPSSTPNQADAGSELVLLEFEQTFTNHNAGDMHFGPNGNLYIASGDGGGSGDGLNSAQNPSLLLGKMLRIDVDTPPGSNNQPECDISGSTHYSIPIGNAFNDGGGASSQGCDEIYALGLRNPWRFSFDKGTGDLWIADVGQGAWEEINHVLADAAGGLNFGWRCFEGNTPFNPTDCDAVYYPPVHAFSHGAGNCSVTGGYVYRGTAYPELSGRYFFTDFCNSAIRTLSLHGGSPVVSEALAAGAINLPSTFGEGADGEIYIASLSTGTIYRIRGTGSTSNNAPNISSAIATPSTIAPGESASLQVTASDVDGPSPLTYQWSVNPSLGSITNATAANATFVASATSSGLVDISIVVDDGLDTTSSTVTLTVATPPPSIELVVDEAHVGAYGNGFGSDAHPQLLAASFNTPGNAPLTLQVTGYDIDFDDELAVYLNGAFVDFLTPGANNALNAGDLLTLPASLLNAGDNTLEFRQPNPGWIWGVTDLALWSTPPGTSLEPTLTLGVTDNAQYGNGFGSDAHPQLLRAHFNAATVSDLELTVTGYDIDFDDELAVYLNNTFIGHLSEGPNNGLNSGDRFTLPSAAVVLGDNVLEFRQPNPGWIWGVTAITVDTLSLEPTLTLGVTDNAQYGNGFGSDAHPQLLRAHFNAATVSNLELTVTGYDIDFDDELAVYLNNTFIGHLSEGPNNGLNSGDRFTLPSAAVVLGDNVLEFRQPNPGWIWGVTAITVDTLSLEPTLTLGVTDNAQYGNGFGSDAHPQLLRAHFNAATVSDLELTVTGYDIDFDDELAVYLNNTFISHLSEGPNNGLNSGDRFTLPSAAVVLGDNVLEFRQPNPGWIWGVTAITVDTSAAPSTDIVLTPDVPDSGAYGNGFGSNAHPLTVTAGFNATANTPFTLQVTGYDIDFNDEISVYLNNTFITHLSKGPNNSLNASDLVNLPAALVVNGTNVIEFRQDNLGWIWGVTDLLLSQQ